MPAVSLTRVYHARRPEVCAAWLDGERLARWLRPLPGALVRAGRADARAGGGFELLLRDPAGRSGSLRGIYRALAAPASLTLALEVVLDGALVLAVDEVRVRFEEEGEGTRLTLEQAAADEAARAALAAGWSECLDRLPAAFDEALATFYGRLQEQPRFRSRFGGLWPDLSDARARLEGKRELGLLDAGEAALFEQWIEKGYARLPGAVPAAAVDRLLAEVEALWRDGRPGVLAEVFAGGGRTFEPVGPAARARPHKVLDLHGHLDSARAVACAPAALRFLTLLFERPPLAFQSLYFTTGTEQDFHQDTAYVIVRSPMEFCGMWIALEDVQEGSGELEYFAGSHTIPEYVWFDRGRGKLHDYADDAEFLRWVREEPERRGLARERLLARKGDVLFWHADLVHGGSKVTRPGVTRRSLVVHWCPKNVDPEYFGTSPHTAKLPHGEGAYWCAPLRGASGAGEARP